MTIVLDTATPCVKFASLFQSPLLEEDTRVETADQRRTQAAMMARATSLCGSCPLRAECLSDAVVHHDVAGIAGGRASARRDQDNAAELAALTTETMRDIVGVLHPIFLEPDQLAELLTSGDDAINPPEPGPFGIVMPTSQAQLDAIVDAELARLFGHSAARNPTGDVAIRVGTTVVFCRSTPDFKELVLFAALVHDVNGRSRACEVLNDLNVESRYCRFALHRDRVFAQVSVPAQPFVPQHFRQALDSISQVADGIDDELASKLGGRTTFPAAG